MYFNDSVKILTSFFCDRQRRKNIYIRNKHNAKYNERISKNDSKLNVFFSRVRNLASKISIHEMKIYR
jgi:hypothetical protein